MTRVTGSGVLSAVLRSASLFFLAILFVACGGGGDSGPPPVSLTAVIVTGMPAEPLAPMQTAQLAARATYSDGSVKDVTATATWSTSDANVLTVSTTGLVTATGPGRAEAVASIGGISGRASVQVVAPPAAYFIDGVEYAFEYQLNSQGRVDNYVISQRAGATYPNPPESDGNVMTCTGSLTGSYQCDRKAPRDWREMEGLGGRLTASRQFWGPYAFSFAYNYAGLSLNAVTFVNAVPHGEGPWFYLTRETTETALGYAAGQLSSVSQSGTLCNDACPICGYPAGCQYNGPLISRVVTDAQGRPQRAEGSPVMTLDELRTWALMVRWAPWDVLKDAHELTVWSYNAAGFLEEAISTRTDSQGLLRNATTRYVVDNEGWLAGRTVRTENRGQSATETTDTYAITRWGAKVAEEKFTQAEPKAFYVDHAPQRVRYEWGRLPTEPTFVPRALTGLNGADYFGVISSHHR